MAHVAKGFAVAALLSAAMYGWTSNPSWIVGGLVNAYAGGVLFMVSNRR